MTGKRKYNLTILSLFIVVVVMLAALATYAVSGEPPSEEVLVWFFICVGSLAGAFSVGNAVEHYSKRPSEKIVDKKQEYG